MQPLQREPMPGEKIRRRDAAHELRNQLQALVALAERAPRREAWARQLRHCADALLDIAEDWLGRGGVCDFAPAATARAIVSALAPAARRKAIGLSCAIAPSCPASVHGDRRAFRALLANLVGNAIKFTEVGRVAVRLSGERIGVIARLRIEVEDTGPGLPATTGDIFRGLARASRRQGGTGLGLARARDSAERLGGRLTAGASAGGGARFATDLTLPVGKPLAETVRAADAMADRRRLRVLLTEDHPLCREFAARHLRARGHQVRAVSEARAALRLAGRGRFDVALLDLRLPGIDGQRLAGHLRALQPGLPIIAWSADRAPAAAARFHSRLGKPCEGDALVAAVEKAGTGGPAADLALARRLLLRGRARECDRLEQASRSGEGTRISDEAHRARGALALAGLTDLAGLARRAEQEARDGRTRQAARTLGKVSDGLRRLGPRLT